MNIGCLAVKTVRGAKTGLVILLAALLITAGCAIFLELGIRVFRYGWKQAYRIIHRGDSEYIFYTVGGSVAFGEPYGDKISFPKIAAYMFDNRIKGRDIKIVNLARSGMSLEYGYWRLFKELTVRPRADGLLLIYAGINDVPGKGPDPGFKAWRIIQYSIVLSKLQYLLGGMSGFPGRYFTVKNSQKKYEFRLKKIINLAQRHGLEVIISTLAGNIREFDTKDKSIYGSKKIMDLIRRARRQEEAGNIGKAVKTYEDIQKKRPGGLPYVYYRLGNCYEELGAHAEARENYWKALEDSDQLRPNLLQNRTIRRLAEEKKIELADVKKAFEEESPHGLMGYNLFIDAHHPNIRGYIIMAREFAKKIKAVTGCDIRNTEVTRQAVIKDFKFSDADLFRVYISRVQWFCSIAENGNEREERLKRAEYYLDKAVELDPDNPLVYLWRFMLASFRKDEEKAMYWLEKGKLLTANRSVFRGRWWLEEWMHLPGHVLDTIRELIEDGKG